MRIVFSFLKGEIVSEELLALLKINMGRISFMSTSLENQHSKCWNLTMALPPMSTVDRNYANMLIINIFQYLYGGTT